MDGKKYEWTYKTTSKLIEMYEAEPCLWNQNDEAYKDRLKRERAILEMANHFGTNRTEIKRKIHNLRNQFNQESYKTLRSFGREAEESKSRWAYFDALKFIRSFIPNEPNMRIYIAPTKKEPVNETDCIEYSNEEEEDIIENNIKDELIKKRTEINGIHLIKSNPVDDIDNTVELHDNNNKLIKKFIIPATHTQQQQTTQSFQPPTVVTQSSISSTPTLSASFSGNMNKRRNTEYSLSEDAPNTMLDNPSMILLESSEQNSSLSSRKCEDEYTTFGQFVGNEIRSIKSLAKRKKLKRMIQKAILEISADDDDEF